MNPYQSPKTEETAIIEPPKRVLYDRRTKAVRAGLWQGAKFGFLACLVIFAIPFAIGMIDVICSFRKDMNANFGGILYPTIVTIPVLIFYFAIAAVPIGALPGAIITGIVAGIMWRRPKESSDTNESTEN